MRKFQRLCFIPLLILWVNVAKSQMDKGDNTFGIQVRTIIPATLLNAEEFSTNNDSIVFAANPATGFSIGGIIRHNFTGMFTLEAGIHFTNRSYRFDVENSLQNASEQTSVNFISYEIPIQGLIYIQLGEKLFMNTMFGLSLDFYPSDVIKTQELYAYIIIRDSWINPSLIGNIGFEYRTKSAGYFYLGASVHYPFKRVALVRLSYYDAPNPSNYVNLDGDLSGTYFSVDFRYFFNSQKEKNGSKNR